MIALEDHAFKSYLGNYDYYKSMKEKQLVPVVEEPVEKMKKQKNPNDWINQEAEKAKALLKIESLENEIKEINLAMARNQIEYEELNQLYCKKLELSKELDSVMEWWISK